MAKLNKEMLKNYIKECVREVILEEGYIAKIVSETITGVHNSGLLAEQRETPIRDEHNLKERKKINKGKTINPVRSIMLEEMSKNAYGGVNVFEDITPINEEKKASPRGISYSQQTGMEYDDPGIDLNLLNQHIPGVRF